jgi:hypothetical protein
VPPSVVPRSVVPPSVVPPSVVPSVVPRSVVPSSVVPPLAPAAAAAAPLAARPATASPGAIGLTDSPVGEFPAEGRSGGSPRRAFSRVRGTRSGRHQADPGQALYAGAPIADVSASNPGQVRSTARHAQGPASPVPASPVPASPVPASPAPSSQAPSSQAPSSQAPSSQAPSSQAPSSPAPSSPAPSSPAPPDLGRASWMPDPAAGQGSSGPEVGPGRPEQEVDDRGSFGWSWSPGPMGSSHPGGG